MNLEQNIARLNFKHESGKEGIVFNLDVKITLRQALRIMEHNLLTLIDPIASWNAISSDGKIIATQEEYIKSGANYLAMPKT